MSPVVRTCPFSSPGLWARWPRTLWKIRWGPLLWRITGYAGSSPRLSRHLLIKSWPRAATKRINLKALTTIRMVSFLRATSATTKNNRGNSIIASSSKGRLCPMTQSARCQQPNPRAEPVCLEAISATASELEQAMLLPAVRATMTAISTWRLARPRATFLWSCAYPMTRAYTARSWSFAKLLRTK